VLFGTTFLKFGSKMTNLASLLSLFCDILYATMNKFLGELLSHCYVLTSQTNDSFSQQNKSRDELLTWSRP